MSLLLAVILAAAQPQGPVAADLQQALQTQPLVYVVLGHRLRHRLHQSVHLPHAE
jgi:hypothetical protein